MEVEYGWVLTRGTLGTESTLSTYLADRVDVLVRHEPRDRAVEERRLASEQLKRQRQLQQQPGCVDVCVCVCVCVCACACVRV